MGKAHAPADAGAGLLASLSPLPLKELQLESASDAHEDPLQPMEDAPPFVVPNAPLFRSPSSMLTTSGNRYPAAGALSAGLSTELRKILNMSTLDPDVTVAGSLTAGDQSTEEDEEKRIERQYLWLERYHAHIANQQVQLNRSISSLPIPSPAQVGDHRPGASVT